jgi:hypothetical protein
LEETTMTDVAQAKSGAPWHFWLVVAVGILWNGFGGYDYTMSHLQGEIYYRQMGMTEAMIAYMDTYPSWMHAVWAIGVWGSVAGSILLLLRSRWAFHAFVLSILGALGNLIYNVATPGGGETMGMVMPLVILAASLFFIWYSSTMTKQGVLR